WRGQSTTRASEISGAPTKTNQTRSSHRSPSIAATELNVLADAIDISNRTHESIHLHRALFNIQAVSAIA
ncbi:hypothetical protein, partial [Pseudomonas syringae]|uniref:hypothetical protein n=1 Tax=Pseudomonas syringae TaxID=317 RepID=UPI001F48274F